MSHERIKRILLDHGVTEISGAMLDELAALRTRPSPTEGLADAWRNYKSAPLSFDGGIISINRDGSGYFCANEKEADWETSDETGETYIVAKFSAGEAQEIRDHLNKYFPALSPASNEAVEALREAGETLFYIFECSNDAHIRRKAKAAADKIEAALSTPPQAEDEQS